MSSIIQQIKNTTGDSVYPVTKTSATYDDNGNRLDNTLTSINDSLSTKANQSQVDTLNSNLAYKSDKPTLKNSILSNNQFTIDSIGKINVISGYCQVASGKCTSGLELFRLPIIPIRGYKIPMIVLRSNSTFNLMCYTGVNGEVNANHDFTFVSGDYLMINATYISKDD